MSSSPSRIKDGTHSDRDFHADLLFQLSAWKFGAGTVPRRVWRRSIGVERLQLGAENGDELGGAEACGRFASPPEG